MIVDHAWRTSAASAPSCKVIFLLYKKQSRNLSHKCSRLSNPIFFPNKKCLHPPFWSLIMCSYYWFKSNKNENWIGLNASNYMYKFGKSTKTDTNQSPICLVWEQWHSFNCLTLNPALLTLISITTIVSLDADFTKFGNF